MHDRINATLKPISWSHIFNFNVIMQKIYSRSVNFIDDITNKWIQNQWVLYKQYVYKFNILLVLLISNICIQNMYLNIVMRLNVKMWLYFKRYKSDFHDNLIWNTEREKYIYCDRFVIVSHGNLIIINILTF